MNSERRPQPPKVRHLWDRLQWQPISILVVNSSCHKNVLIFVGVAAVCKCHMLLIFHFMASTLLFMLRSLGVYSFCSFLHLFMASFVSQSSNGLSSCLQLLELDFIDFYYGTDQANEKTKDLAKYWEIYMQITA